MLGLGGVVRRTAGRAGDAPQRKVRSWEEAKRTPPGERSATRSAASVRGCRRYLLRRSTGATKFIEEGSAAGDVITRCVDMGYRWVGSTASSLLLRSRTKSHRLFLNCEARPIHIPITDDEDSDESEDILAAREAESSEELRKRRKIAKFDNEAQVLPERSKAVACEIYPWVPTMPL